MKRLSLIVLVGLMLSGLVLSGCDGGSETVRVATDAAWPPFEYVDEATKDIVGFDIELMNAIAERGGFEVEFINVAWDPLMAGMAQCNYDAAISAMTITEERKQSFNFSEPYFAARQIVTVRSDNTDISGKDSLSGKTVGAQSATTGAMYVSDNLPDVTLKTYDDVGLAFQDLMNGQIDAVVADNPLALGYVRENPDKLKTVGDVFTDEIYGIAVCKTNTELLEKINKGLAAVIEEGLLDELVVKWIGGTE